MRIQIAIVAAGLMFSMSFAHAFAAPATATAPVTRPAAVTKPATSQASVSKPATAAAATMPMAEAPAATTNPAFAERLSDLAQLTARTSAPSNSVWNASACLFEAAARHDGEQPRYRRLQVDSLTRAGDNERATEALALYRKLTPTDRMAQVQQIDFYVARMQTAEAKVAYLRGLLNASAVAPAVRSHAAVLCAELMAQRGEDAIANKVLDQALSLNPLNIQALQLRYRQVAQGSAAERTAALVALVKANPAQPAVLNALAREIADAALTADSLKLFEFAVRLTGRLNQIDTALALDYAFEQMIASDPRKAATIAGQLISFQPDNMGAWMVQIMAARASGNKEAIATLQKQSTVAMANRLAVIRKAVGDAAATTRPLNTPDAVASPDPGDTVQRIQASGKKELLNDLITLAADVAWIRVYFDGKVPEAVPWINVLKSTLPADNLTVPRLEGWALLQSGKGAEGKARLTPIAPRDPLAAMGLAMLAFQDPQQQQQAMADARKLLDENASGLIGAILSDAFRDRGLKVEAFASSDAVKKELAKLQMDSLKIIDKPQDFYSVRYEPVRSSIRYSEPIYVSVTFQNVGDFDLTVGDDGVLHPDIWIDAGLRGIAMGQQFPAVAYERFGQEIVLPAGASMTQLVRLDQGDLSRLLNANPGPSLHISSAVLTNPMSYGQQIGAGPVGQRAPMIGVIQRNGSTVATEEARQKLSETLAAGEPAEKIRAIDLCTTFYQVFSQQQDNDSKVLAQFCVELVQRATADSEPSVRSWAWYLTALLTPPANRAAYIDRMLRDEAWQMRTLGLMISQQTGELRDRAKALAANDPEELVRRYANAVIAIPPSTQPSTKPALDAGGATTQPATGPTTR